MFAVETSDTVQIVNTIANCTAAIVGTAGGVLVAYIAWQQNKIKSVLGDVKTQTDGLASALGATKLAQGDAEGQLKGIQQARDEMKAETKSAAAAVPAVVADVTITAENVSVEQKPPQEKKG